jgi:hypothetical protein
MCWQRHEWFDGSVAASSDGRRPEVRVSDADRHAVIDELQRHTGDGRLTLDEFEQRVDEVLQARTGAELDATMRDLPRAAPRPPRRSHRARRPFRPGLVAVLVVVALAVTGTWWALIPIGFFVFGGWGHHAPPPRSQRRDERDVTYV